MADVAVEPEVQVPPTRSRRWRPWAVGLVVVGVVAAGWFGWRWLHHPDPMGSYPAYGLTAPLRAGHRLYIDAGFYPASKSGHGPYDQEMTINSITPRVVENSSAANLQLLVCRRNGSRSGIGSQTGGLSNSCESVHPFSGPETIDLGFMTAQIVLKVVPHQPGVLHITGFDVSYSQGLRHAHQVTGVDLKVTTVR